MKKAVLFLSLLSLNAFAAGDEFTLVLKNHRFEPAELRVPADKKVKLIIDNQDATPEEFESHELNREKVIAAGSKGTVYIGPLAPGRYPFFGEFNAKTAQMEKGMPIPVVITAYQDRSFTFEMKLPPMSYWLKKAAGLQSGSKTPGRGTVGKVTKAQIREIAEKKLPDLNCDTVEAAAAMVEGSARSMGLEVVG